MPSHSHTVSDSGHYHIHSDYYGAESGQDLIVNASNTIDSDFIDKIISREPHRRAELRSSHIDLTEGLTYTNRNTEKKATGISINSSGGTESFSLLSPYFVVNFIIKY